PGPMVLARRGPMTLASDTLTDSCRSVLPSPPLQALRLTTSPYEATHGFTHVTARHFAAPGRAPWDLPVPLLPDTSRCHAGDLATQSSVLVGVDSFHSTGLA